VRLAPFLDQRVALLSEPLTGTYSGSGIQSGLFSLTNNGASTEPLVEAALTFYYRVDKPVVWIECDQHPGVVFDNTVPPAHYIHTIVRTLNGGDYGIDL
jgi:hypothetical protein